MGSSGDSLEFNLTGIKTMKFDAIEENFTEDKLVNFNTDLEFGIDPTKKLVVVNVKANFSQQKSVFLTLSVATNFKIASSSWKKYKDENTLTLDKEFMIHFAALTIGICRGILHSKTENTIYNKFSLPLVDLSETITESASFELK